MSREFDNLALISPVFNGDMNGSNFTDLAGTGASAYLPLTKDGFGHYTKNDAGVLSVVTLDALDKQIDFSTLHTDVDKSRYFDGLNGEKHVAYSGNHIALNEDGDTGQSVSYIDDQTHNSYFDVATKSRIQQVATGTTYELLTSHSDYMTSTKALTVAELAQCDANPDSIYNVWFNGHILSDGFAKIDMVNYFPISFDNGSEYIQDVSVDLGGEEYSGGDISGNTIVSTPIPNGFNVVATSEDRFYLGGTSISTGLIVVTFNVVVTAGSMTIIRAYDGSGYVTTGLPYTVINGANTLITTSTSIVGRLLHLDVSTSTFNIDFTNISVRGLVGYAEINNYTDNSRQLFSNQEYGLQSIMTLQDSSGRPTGITPPNTIQVGNGGYVETNFTPSDSYELTEGISGILQEFGVEEYSGGDVTTNNGTTTPIANGFNVVSSAETRWFLAGTAISTGLILLTFDAHINSGSLSFGRAYDGSDYITTGLPYQIVEGHNSMVITSTTVAGRLAHIDLIVGATFDIDFTNISVKELTTKTQTTEERRLRVYKLDTDEYYVDDILEATPPLPAQTEMVLNNVALIGYADDITQINSFSTQLSESVMTDAFQGYFNTQSNITQADRDLILDTPETMNRLMIDDDLATGLSFTKGDVLSYFSGAEGLRGTDKLYDHVSTTEITIQDYTEATSTNLQNQTVGSSNLMVVQDASGRELSMVESGTVAVDSSGKNINTGFKPPLSDMSLRNIVSGELEDLDTNGVGLGTYSQRVEDRFYVKEESKDALLYINGVVQSYTPDAPDPAQVLLYNEVACLGHPDNVTLHHATIEGWTTIKTPQEIQDAYNDFIS